MLKKPFFISELKSVNFKNKIFEPNYFFLSKYSHKKYKTTLQLIFLDTLVEQPIIRFWKEIRDFKGKKLSKKLKITI